MPVTIIIIIVVTMSKGGHTDVRKFLNLWVISVLV